jgi:hypothetical protein
MKTLLVILTIISTAVQTANGQHYYSDSFIAQKADSFIIDGVGDEPFWEQCDWYDMAYVWIPYGDVMSLGDFSGKVKFAWTEDKLLILAEIEDDVLSDTHSQPQDNYWNDDCLEIFLDEDYSGGWHQNSYNAFAYHCAINETDVIDLGDEDASNVNLKDHIEFDLDTIDDTHFIWELAISIYDDSFNESNLNNSEEMLEHNMNMGISVAYCDNDGGMERENFIGLVNVDTQHYNSSWQDASVFGKLTLKDAGVNVEQIIENRPLDNVNVYMDRYSNLIIDTQGKSFGLVSIAIYDLYGKLLNEFIAKVRGSVSLKMQNFETGIYIVNFKSEKMNITNYIVRY